MITRVFSLLALLAMTSSVVHAMAPPHPDFAEEYYEQRRLSLPNQNADNYQFDYEPSFVNPELCQFLTADECKDVNDNMLQHAATQCEFAFASQN